MGKLVSNDSLVNIGSVIYFYFEDKEDIIKETFGMYLFDKLDKEMRRRVAGIIANTILSRELGNKLHNYNGSKRNNRQKSI